MGNSTSNDKVQMASRDYVGTGKVAIVTGPTGTGIGFHTARWLAERGVHVILAGRSQSRLTECEANIRAVARNADGTPNVDVQLTSLLLDLGSLASIESFVTSFVALNLPRLDILINNAGIIGYERSVTIDGIESTFATNHLGVQHLTQLLMPTLLASTPSRIVTVSSLGHRFAKMTAANIDQIDSMVVHPTAEAYGTWAAYSNSKLYNILMTRVLNRRYAAHGVTSYSVHPGMVTTEIHKTATSVAKFVTSSMINWASKSSEDGAGTSIYCATHDDALAHAGAFFDRCRVSTTSAQGADDTLADAVFKATEDVIAKANEKRKSIATTAEVIADL